MGEAYSCVDGNSIVNAIPALDRTSPVPLYFQLKQIIIEKIERNEWDPGQPIPSEQDLQDLYGLSRTTVRQALSELVIEGRLVRLRGKGTFIVQPKLTHTPQKPQGLVRLMIDRGLRPGWRVLSIEWTSPPYEVQHLLNLDPDAQTLYIRRLRLANEQPIGYHQVWLPPGVADQINRDALVEGDSLAYMRHLPALSGAHTVRTIEAIAAETAEAELLGVRENEPLLLIQRLLYASDETPLEVMEALYCGNQFKYQIVLPTVE